MPGMKPTGTNTASSTSEVATIGPVTSRIACTAASRGAKPSAQFPLHVLDDDDGVVDDDADRQHQAEQGDGLMLKPERVHRREGADQRDRNGDGRDHRHPPVLQKDVDDEDDQGQRFQQRLHAPP